MTDSLLDELLELEILPTPKKEKGKEKRSRRQERQHEEEMRRKAEEKEKQQRLESDCFSFPRENHIVPVLKECHVQPRFVVSATGENGSVRRDRYEKKGLCTQQRRGRKFSVPQPPQQLLKCAPRPQR